MTCKRCSDLDQTWLIRSPDELGRAILVAKGNLEDGTLKQISGNSPIGTQQLDSLNENGPWPDFIDCRFACTGCGTNFQLTAETYHGSGGRWARMGQPGGGVNGLRE